MNDLAKCIVIKGVIIILIIVTTCKLRVYYNIALSLLESAHKSTSESL